jgi:2-polyprenyl-3-methyl-5-hydroxy-6-metoxy-1,4-benzoquinol methylase
MPHSNDDPILKAKLAVARARTEVHVRREEATAALGGALGRFGRRLALRPHRGERVELPPLVEVGDHRFDVVDDLVAYTGLPRAQVDDLVRRRSDSFRAEWFLTPPERRVDNWFYLSSTTYLFGNAVHDPLPFLALLERVGATPGRVLDFGGGTGNLALALAAAGWDVEYLERSALQKDFVAFRADRHGLHERVRILDQWRRLKPDRYDAAFAVDVLEHIADLDAVLRKLLLPALREAGRLVESSPFIRTLSNPMHHEHTQLDMLLASEGFVVEVAGDGARVWRRAPQNRGGVYSK